MSVTEIHILQQVCNKTRRDKVKNEDIHTKIGIISFEEKIQENYYNSLVI